MINCGLRANRPGGHLVFESVCLDVCVCVCVQDCLKLYSTTLFLAQQKVTKSQKNATLQLTSPWSLKHPLVWIPSRSTSYSLEEQLENAKRPNQTSSLLTPLYPAKRKYIYSLLSRMGQREGTHENNFSFFEDCFK